LSVSLADPDLEFLSDPALLLQKSSFPESDGCLIRGNVKQKFFGFIRKAGPTRTCDECVHSFIGTEAERCNSEGGIVVKATKYIRSSFWVAFHPLPYDLAKTVAFVFQIPLIHNPNDFDSLAAWKTQVGIDEVQLLNTAKCV
jgi:hypothetical protein